MIWVLLIIFLVGTLVVAPAIILPITLTSAASARRVAEVFGRIFVGMALADVVALIGNPAFIGTLPDGCYVYVYKKGAKGNRTVECVFSADNVLVAINNK